MKKYFIKYQFISGGWNTLTYTDKAQYEAVLEQKREDPLILGRTLTTWEETK